MNQKFFLLAVFTVGFFLRVITAAGAEVKETKESVTKAETVKTEGTVTVEKLPAATENGITKIENHIHIHGTPSEKGDDKKADKVNDRAEELKEAAAILSNKKEEAPTRTASIQPMIGLTSYTGSWQNLVTSRGNVGLILDLPVSSVVSVELETGLGQYQTKYTSRGAAVSHKFNQGLVGMNGKIYLGQSFIRPYLIAGFSGLYYDTMYRDARVASTKYDQWVGAAQAGVGGELALSTNFGVGLRASYFLPTVNRPSVKTNQGSALEGYEDAALMDNGFYRAMAFIRLGL